MLIFGNVVIRWLQGLKFGEEIRELGPAEPQDEGGHPHHGRGAHPGSGACVSILLWGNLSNHYLVLLILATVFLGLLGFADDYMKSMRKVKNGMSARMKIVFQFLIALGVVLAVYFFPSNPKYTTRLFIPFVNEAILDMAWVWVVFAVIVVVGSSNAVNLTDGLDGLAVGSVIIVAGCLGIMTYLTGHVKIATYLRIPYIPHSAELTVFLSALIGAGIGFLWFNCNPASVFMGDTGSLALGGIIGIVAVMIKKEIFLFIVGGVFVLEALSVIIQVASFQAHRQEGIQDGAHPSSLRALGLAGAEGRGADVDHRHNTGDFRTEFAEDTVGPHEERL